MEKRKDGFSRSPPCLSAAVSAFRLLNFNSSLLALYQLFKWRAMVILTLGEAVRFGTTCVKLLGILC